MARNQIKKEIIDTYGLLFDHYFPITHEKVAKEDCTGNVIDKNNINIITMDDEGCFWQRRKAIEKASIFFDYVLDISGELIFGVIDCIEDNYE